MMLRNFRDFTADESLYRRHRPSGAKLNADRDKDDEGGVLCGAVPGSPAWADRSHVNFTLVV